MSGLVKRIVEVASKEYGRIVGGRLAKYGLKYDDLHVESDDVLEALKRLSPEDYALRLRRLKRAIDISAKHKALPDEIQALQQPFDAYLQPYLEQVKLEKVERELINSYK